LIYLFLGLFCLSSISAFLWMFMVSLKTTPEFVSSSPWALPSEPHFENYIKAWGEANIGSYFGNSLLVATVGATTSVIISALVAYILGRIGFKLREFFANYFLIGYMIPLILTVIPLFFLISSMGIKSGMVPLILLYIASGVPFNTLILRGFFESLPLELEEAAAIDGATPFRIFWQIMLPLCRGGLVAAFLINFLSLWNEFFLALIFLRQKNATLPLGLYIMANKAEYTAQWTDVFAAMFIASVPVFIIFAFLHNQIRRGLTTGAIKG
jgi:ABC-type glycerol-3-phosphate transport system permease component